MGISPIGNDFRRRGKGLARRTARTAESVELGLPEVFSTWINDVAPMPHPQSPRARKRLPIARAILEFGLPTFDRAQDRFSIVG